MFPYLFDRLSGFGVDDGSLGEDCEDFGDSSVGDPDLGPVEDVVLAVGGELRLGLDAVGVGAAGRLRQSEGGELLAGGQLGKVLGLLLLVAADQDALHGESNWSGTFKNRIHNMFWKAIDLALAVIIRRIH